MSRPIYEPTLERADAALGYDKNQLQRRPYGQRMDTPIPWVRMKRTAAFSVSGDGIQRNPFLVADGNTVTDQSVESLLPYFDLVEDPSPAPSEYVIEFYLPGFYACRFHAEWSSPGSAFFHTTRLQYGVKQANPGWAVGRHPNVWSNLDPSPGTLPWQTLFDSVMIFQEDIDSAGSADRMYPQVAQTSGSPINITCEFQFWRYPFEIGAEGGS